MDETRLDYCSKCLDDHETRLRHLEANNKEQAKLYVISDKLGDRITSLDDKMDVRFNALEKLVEVRVAVVTAEKSVKSESRSDMYSLIGMIISVGTFVILVWKLAL